MALVNGPASAAVPVGDAFTSLLVVWRAPPSANGSDVVEYEVECWKSADCDEVEVIEVETGANTNGNPLEGTFVVSYDGWSTDHLSVDTSKDAMVAALGGLPSLPSVHVERAILINSTNAKSKKKYRLSNRTVQWAVTFLSEAPCTAGKTLSVDGAGLGAAKGTVRARVGYDLTPFKPG